MLALAWSTHRDWKYYSLQKRRIKKRVWQIVFEGCCGRCYYDWRCSRVYNRIFTVGDFNHWKFWKREKNWGRCSRLAHCCGFNVNSRAGGEGGGRESKRDGIPLAGIVQVKKKMGSSPGVNEREVDIFPNVLSWDWVCVFRSNIRLFMEAGANNALPENPLSNIGF